MAKRPVKKAVPKGFHRMPNGKLMKGAKHPTKKRSKTLQTTKKRAY
jgi:hypothetical protein